MGPAPPLPPPGWTVVGAAGSPVLGSAIRVLYWWPHEGWQLGRVPRRRRRGSRRAPFTHVQVVPVGYRLATAGFAGEVDSLLDAASYGSPSRWVALHPVPGRG